MEERKLTISFGTAFVLGAGLALGSRVVFIIPYIILFVIVGIVSI